MSTRDTIDTITARVQSEPAYARALLQQATSLLMQGEPHTAKLLLRDLVNASQKGDIQLKEIIKKEQSNLWLEEHADLVKAYNQTVAKEGLPLSEWTKF